MLKYSQYINVCLGQIARRDAQIQIVTIEIAAPAAALRPVVGQVARAVLVVVFGGRVLPEHVIEVVRVERVVCNNVRRWMIRNLCGEKSRGN